MDQSQIEIALAGLPLGEIRYFDTVGSTNDLAADWANENPPDLSLVIADEQTAGRGRAGRTWYTPPRAALAFTIVIRPPAGTGSLPLLTGLGGVSVCEAFAEAYALPAEIKWPNDVLINRRKVCGILAEAHWLGGHLQALIVGIGINVAPPSVPPAEALSYPATCVETALGRRVDRLRLLRLTLSAFIGWRARLNSPEFVHAWEERLAFRDERVQVILEGNEPVAGWILGLTPEGRLKLKTPAGDVRAFGAGEVRLRPV